MKKFLPKKKDADLGDQPAKPKQPQKYFWTVFLEKRKKKKMRPAYQALPKQPPTKEEKIKLLVCGIIVLIIIVGMPIAFKLNAAHRAAQDAKDAVATGAPAPKASADDSKD